MRFFLILTMLCCTTAVFGGKEHVRHGKVTYEQSLTTSKVKAAVVKALIRRGWHVQESDTQELSAYLAKKGFRADILVTWQEGTISIIYKSSVGLGYVERRGDKRIHGNYNKWILNLERDITVFLTD